MNWIERMYEIKGKDPYSQNGEGIYLEYVLHSLPGNINYEKIMIDIGCGDIFHLSNSRWLAHTLGFKSLCFDTILGNPVSQENCVELLYGIDPTIISIDIDGNDYWILSEQLRQLDPLIVIAEFNPAFTDSRTIKYNPSHEWAGDDYYGFSFEAGKKLAEKHGYEIIFNVANMNLIMVRKDLINVTVPPVTYEQVKFFKESNREDWEFV